VNKTERDQLSKLARLRAKQAEREAEAREKVLLAEVQDQLTAQFDDHDQSMPSAEQLMPPLRLEDLGVVRWQPPEDAAAQLTTPQTPAAKRRRRILRAIEANPGASDRRIAEIAGCDHKTVSAHRNRGEMPAIVGKTPANDIQDLPGDADEGSNRGCR
jgi:hypothetical protein